MKRKITQENEGEKVTAALLRMFQLVAVIRRSSKARSAARSALKRKRWTTATLRGLKMIIIHYVMSTNRLLRQRI